MSEELTALAIPGTHDRFLSFFRKLVNTEDGVSILDVGAGQGALTKKLHQAGAKMSACELDPDVFRYHEVECKEANLSKSLPYSDESFDAVVAVEVLEHLENVSTLFSEAARVLKDGGIFAASTPNILSLKSRLRFLASGFFYSFSPLGENSDGLSHISSLTLDQYRYIAGKYGFDILSVDIDVRQNSSIMLMWLWPLLRILPKFQRVNFNIHNQFKLLVGRKLFMAFKLPD